MSNTRCARSSSDSSRSWRRCAVAGRLPVGPRADDRVAEAVRARGNLRGARGDRPRTITPRCAKSSATSCSRRCSSRRSKRRRPLHDRRLAAARSPTSWCGAIRTSSRATPARAAARLGRRRCESRWEEIKAQERARRAPGDSRAKTLARRHRAGAAGAAARVPHRHARRVGRLRLDARRRCDARRFRRKWTNCAKSSTADGASIAARAEEEMGDLLFAIAQPRAKAGHRARDRAAQGERQVHAALQRHGNGDRSVGTRTCAR